MQFLQLARISTRSLASRLDSGSSIRNTAGLAHDRASQRHALALATRELRAGAEPIQLADAELARSRLIRAGATDPPSLERWARIRNGNAMFPKTRHVRVQRVALEDHCHVAARRDVVDHALADQDRARRLRPRVRR